METLDHLLNLRKVAKQTVAKGKSGESHYIYVNETFKGNPQKLSAEEIIRIEKKVEENSKKVIAFLQGLRKQQKGDKK